MWPHTTETLGACTGSKVTDNALVQLQKGLEIHLRVLGSEHPHVAVSYKNIGNVYSAQGKHDEALLQH